MLKSFSTLKYVRKYSNSILISCNINMEITLKNVIRNFCAAVYHERLYTIHNL